MDDSLISTKLITNLELRIVFRAKIQHDRHPLEDSLLASLPIRRGCAVDYRGNSAVCWEEGFVSLCTLALLMLVHLPLSIQISSTVIIIRFLLSLTRLFSCTKNPEYSV